MDEQNTQQPDTVAPTVSPAEQHVVEKNSTTPAKKSVSQEEESHIPVRNVPSVSHNISKGAGKGRREEDKKFPKNIAEPKMPKTVDDSGAVYNYLGKLDTTQLSNYQLRVLSSLRRNHGIVLAMCNDTGVARDTFYRWRRENPTFAALVDRIDDDNLDFAEMKLWEQIEKGNITTITTYLKTRHAKYSDKVSVSGKLTVSPSWYDKLEGTDGRKTITTIPATSKKKELPPPEPTEEERIAQQVIAEAEGRVREDANNLPTT